jgi:hypothetical protein
MMLHSANPSYDYLTMQMLAASGQQEITQLECKKNKATKQAERKRKKRKTGANISIRFK